MLARCLADLTLILIKGSGLENGAELADVTSEVIEGTDGYTVKVYNPGQKATQLKLTLSGT